MPFNEEWSAVTRNPIGYFVDSTIETDAMDAIDALHRLLKRKRPAHPKNLTSALEKLEMIRHVVKYFTLRYTMGGWFDKIEIFRQEGAALHAVPEPALQAFGRWLKEIPPEAFPELDPGIREQVLSMLGVTETEYQERFNAFLLLKNKVSGGK